MHKQARAIPKILISRLRLGSSTFTARAGTPAGSPVLNSFTRPQFRTTRSRVAINFVLRGRHGLFSQLLVVALLRSLPDRIFHDPVFQRVETDHYQPSARLEHLRRL